MIATLGALHECVDRPDLPCPACLAAEHTPAQKRILATIQPTVGGKEPQMKVFIYVPPALHDRITETAKECNVSVSEFCRQALTSFLTDLETENV